MKGIDNIILCILYCGASNFVFQLFLLIEFAIIGNKVFLNQRKKILRLNCLIQMRIWYSIFYNWFLKYYNILFIICHNGL